MLGPCVQGSEQKVIWQKHFSSSTRKCCMLANSVKLYPTIRFDEGWAGSVNVVQLADAVFTKPENCVITAETQRALAITFHGKVCRQATLSARGFCFCLWLLKNELKTLLWGNVCECWVQYVIMEHFYFLALLFLIQQINRASISFPCCQYWSISCANCPHKFWIWKSLCNMFVSLHQTSVRRRVLSSWIWPNVFLF